MILVTGGTGYIGSHTSVELLAAGESVILLDNLCNSGADVIESIEKITGKKPLLVAGDIRDESLLDCLFAEHPIKAVMHFSGLKSVNESVSEPLRYYDNNVSGTLTLLRVMGKHGVKTIVFSSSATVYGEPEQLPITETARLQPTNPYGRSKLMIEEVLLDLATSDKEWRIGILRYFNPVGAHESGLIGEAPHGIPNNLMPYLTRVALGDVEYLSIFGDDYSTPDGTGIRDYIHVVDLAQGHLKALNYLSSSSGAEVFNLGSGLGHSVLEIVAAFEQASGRKINYRIAPRRAGDVASSFADPSKAEKTLQWKANKKLDQMCADSWCWGQR